VSAPLRADEIRWTPFAQPERAPEQTLNPQPEPVNWRDYRDEVIRELADSEAALADLLTDAIVEAQSYREVAQAASRR
jgi:hypothetical protein